MLTQKGRNGSSIHREQDYINGLLGEKRNSYRTRRASLIMCDYDNDNNERAGGGTWETKGMVHNNAERRARQHLEVDKGET